MEEKRKRTRREFLRISALATAGVALAACKQPTPAPATLASPAHVQPPPSVTPDVGMVDVTKSAVPEVSVEVENDVETMAIADAKNRVKEKFPELSDMIDKIDVRFVTDQEFIGQMKADGVILRSEQEYLEYARGYDAMYFIGSNSVAIRKDSDTFNEKLGIWPSEEEKNDFLKRLLSHVISHEILHGCSKKGDYISTGLLESAFETMGKELDLFSNWAEGTIESFGFNIRGPDAYFLAAIEEVVVNQVNDELVGYSEIAKMSYPYISYEISQECMNFFMLLFPEHIQEDGTLDLVEFIKHKANEGNYVMFERIAKIFNQGNYQSMLHNAAEAYARYCFLLTMALGGYLSGNRELEQFGIQFAREVRKAIESRNPALIPTFSTVGSNKYYTKFVTEEGFERMKAHKLAIISYT